MCRSHENIGDVYWNDVTHEIKAEMSLGGSAKSRLSDYFEGTIKDKDGNVLSNFTGSYLSHIDFDGKRYWDIRHNIDIEEFPIKKQLKSSSIYREDSLLLYERKLDEAQDAKTVLEEIQRRDRRLRKAWKDYGSVESVKKEKNKYVIKERNDNLYSEEKDEEDKKDVLKNEKAGMNIENEEDIPEEEKLEE